MFNRSLWWVAATALAMLLPLSASAEMSDSDRQARCENNQTRLATLERQLASYASDEDIARLRTGMRAIDRYHADMRALPLIHGAPDAATLDRMTSIIWERLKGLSRHDSCNDAANGLDRSWCVDRLGEALQSRIDDAVRQTPQRDAVARDVANTQARLAELQCNAPEPPSGESATGWHAAGSGDCSGQDEDSSSGLLPDPGMCTAARAGKVAVCWDGSNRFHNHYGETHGHSTYPWCTYKSTGSCGGGENTGRLYICRP